MFTPHKTLPPTKHTLQMFGVDDEPILLTGGEGQSYRAGNIVLKPVSDLYQTNWIADALSSLSEAGFRVNRPVKTIKDEWIHDGWQAFSFVKGQTEKGRWNEKIAVSRAFHKALVSIEKPSFIGTRDNPWEVADQTIWNNQLDKNDFLVRQVTDRLMNVKQPLQISEQLIHGDMTGNILFDESLPPAVIDFSPYWRPAEYATAIIIVDSIVWEGADDSLLSELENTFENNQLLIQAALWRIRTTEEFSKINKSDPTEDILHYSHFIDLLLERIAEEK